MLTNKEPLIFVRSERIQGENKEGKPYDFGNVTFSDGFESVTLPIDKEKVLSLNQIFKKGDKVNIVVDVQMNGTRAYFAVSEVLKAS